MKSGEIRAQEEEVQKIEWLSYENALERLTYNNSKQLLKKAWKDYRSIK